MDDLPKTYASALLELAENNDIVDQIHGDIDTLNVRFKGMQSWHSRMDGSMCSCVTSWVWRA